jgi:hypothetical protein
VAFRYLADGSKDAELEEYERCRGCLFEGQPDHVAFKFSARVAFIKFIGTHAQYDRVSSATVSQF